MEKTDEQKVVAEKRDSATAAGNKTDLKDGGILSAGKPTDKSDVVTVPTGDVPGVERQQAAVVGADEVIAARHDKEHRIADDNARQIQHNIKEGFTKAEPGPTVYERLRRPVDPNQFDSHDLHEIGANRVEHGKKVQDERAETHRQLRTKGHENS